MLLSNFIQQLQTLKDKQGDIEVILKGSIPDMSIRGITVDVEFFI